MSNNNVLNNRFACFFRKFTSSKGGNPTQFMIFKYLLIDTFCKENASNITDNSSLHCDRNYLVNKCAYVHNIQSRIKKKVEMPQIQKCDTRYSSPYWCSVPNISKPALWFPRKMWQANFTRKFAYVHNIQSRVKQEVDMPQIQKRVTW